MNRVNYVNELNTLVSNVENMGNDLLKTLDIVIKNFTDKNADIAYQVIENDDNFDCQELSIEKKCFDLLLLQAPVATDLREISSILKLVGDLERIADHCSDISEYILNLTKYENCIDIPSGFNDILKIMRCMVHDSIKAISTNNCELAQNIIATDNKVDAYFVEIFNELIKLMQKNPQYIPQYVDYLMIAKYIERIADHTTNISAWIIYIVKNKLVKN